MKQRQKSFDRNQTTPLSTSKQASEQNEGGSWLKTPEKIGVSKIEKLQQPKTSPLKTQPQLQDDSSKLRSVQLRVKQFILEAQQRKLGRQFINDYTTEAKNISNTTKELFARYNKEIIPHS